MSFENFQVTFPAPLAGLSAFTASDGPLPTGVYTVQFTGAKLVNKKDGKAGKNIEITTKVLGGHFNDPEKKPQDFVGRESKTWPGAPGTGGVNAKGESTDETNMRKIRAILESIGFPAQVVDQVKDFQPAYLLQTDAQGQLVKDAAGNPVGHTAYIHVIESNQTQDGDTSFITKAKYDLYVAGQWKPAEQGRPSTRQGAARGGGLPGVGAMPNVGSAMAGIANPLAAGGAPAAGLANPAFAGGVNGAGGSPQPIGPNAGGTANGLGALVR